MGQRTAFVLVGTFLSLLAFGRSISGCTGDDPVFTAPATTNNNNGCDGGECTALSAECTADKDCTSLCMKCDVARNKCAFVARGEAPLTGACPAKTGLDAICTPGGCDGTAAKCLQATLETTCRAATCDPADRTEILTALCAANGTCAVPQPASCGGNNCTGSACARVCALDGECTSTHYCDGKNCQQKKTKGAACVDNKECANDLCADGFCCDKACTGACERCNAVGALGTCTFVTALTAFHGTCTNQGQNPCGGRCDGTKAACDYPTTQCQAATCSDHPEFGGVPAGSWFKLAVNCAAGSCATTAEALCPDNFRCNGTGPGGACHTKPCDSPPSVGDEECYGSTVCKQHINPALNFCAP